MKQGRNTIIIAILATVPLFANGQTGGNEQGAAPRRDYEVHDIGALDALIQLGQLYDQPMGIVCGDKKIATTHVSVRAHQATTQEAMTLLIGQLPGYEWGDRSGVVLVQPRVLPLLSEKMLQTVIPKFVAKDSGTEQLSALLWWELQRRLDPESAGTGYWGISHDPVRIGLIDLSNVTTGEVLSEIVRRRKSAAWVVLPPPETLKGTPRERLWGIVTYTNPAQPLDRLCCLNREYFR